MSNNCPEKETGFWWILVKHNRPEDMKQSLQMIYNDLKNN